MTADAAAMIASATIEVQLCCCVIVLSEWWDSFHHAMISFMLPCGCVALPPGSFVRALVLSFHVLYRSLLNPRIRKLSP